MYRILQEKMASVQAEAVDFARQLIQIKSLSLEESKAAELIEQTMKTLGYGKVFRDEFGNVVGLVTGVRAEPTILLNCHMDTVPPVKGEGHPWSGTIENGHLLGLGAADCKGGLAAQVFAGALLKRSLLPFKGNLIITATTAEENGLSIGLRELIRTTLPDLGLKPDFAILGEPTGLGLYHGHDGWMDMDVRVEGLNPFNVDDAVNAIVGDMAGAPNGVLGQRREMFKISKPNFSNRGGKRSASLHVAQRLGLDEEEDNVVSQVKNNLVKMIGATGGQVAVDVMVSQDKQRLYTGQVHAVRHVTQAWATDPFHPMIDRARQSLEAAGCIVRPGKWQLGRLGMGTAGSVLVNEFHIPTVGYGPGLETQAHALGEFVEIDKLTSAIYGTAIIAHSLVGIPVCGWTSDEI